VKRFRNRVEIKFVLGELVEANFSCNSFVSLFVNNSLIVKWRDLSPPDVDHGWAKLGEQIIGVFFSILY